MTSRAAVGLTLSGVVLAAAALWGTLGQQIDVPTVFGDELIHWDASRSLAAGDGLEVRDAGYGFGPIYPVLLAPVHLLTADDLSAYQWARLWNALLFALAAVPVYHLARRLLEPGWSLACAALAVAIPSALYTGFVMTEGAAYAACCLALLALARCLERPTVAASARWRRCARARGGRPAPARRARSRPRRCARRSASCSHRGLRLPSVEPTSPASGRCSSCSGSGRSRSPCGSRSGTRSRGYGDLWRSYDAVEVARWSWRALAGLGVYLALVPLVLAPAALAALASRAPPAASPPPPHPSRSSSP